jgi:hypothetical protein
LKIIFRTPWLSGKPHLKPQLLRTDVARALSASSRSGPRSGWTRPSKRPCSASAAAMATALTCGRSTWARRPASRWPGSCRRPSSGARIYRHIGNRFGRISNSSDRNQCWKVLTINARALLPKREHGSVIVRSFNAPLRACRQICIMITPKYWAVARS